MFLPVLVYSRFRVCVCATAIILPVEARSIRRVMKVSGGPYGGSTGMHPSVGLVKQWMFEKCASFTVHILNKPMEEVVQRRTLLSVVAQQIQSHTVCNRNALRICRIQYFIQDA